MVRSPAAERTTIASITAVAVMLTISEVPVTSVAKVSVAEVAVTIRPRRATLELFVLLLHIG
jgi:hypothetical protein